MSALNSLNLIPENPSDQIQTARNYRVCLILFHIVKLSSKDNEKYSKHRKGIHNTIINKWIEISLTI